MSKVAADIITFAILLAGVVAFPWFVMRALVPTLEGSGAARVSNYRGRTVVLGLGLVWVVWTIGLGFAGAVLAFVGRYAPPEGGQPYSVLAVAAPVTLVLGALALGLADDVFGSGVDRGFRGHLGALFHGRLTTGGLKLLGIGLLAALAAGTETIADFPSGTARWVLAVLAIALTANLINLLDLRPGRALKAYSLLAVLAALAMFARGEGTTALELLVVLLGPVAAVWRFDLRERAMLGDAGANAAGALIGWVAVVVFSEWWQLAIYVAVVLALNVTSERVSFSRVIEGNRVLSWLDGLGRLAHDDDPKERPHEPHEGRLTEN